MKCYPEDETKKCPKCGTDMIEDQDGWWDDDEENGGACIGELWNCPHCGDVEKI